MRETCYDGYTTALDSDFSSELPDRQASVVRGHSERTCWPAEGVRGSFGVSLCEQSILASQHASGLGAS